MQKSGFVSIIGKPNSGKSTLFNNLVGDKLSVITYKPQTTRNKITGILTEGNTQIVFLDTPGYLKPKYKMQQYMEDEIDSSLEDTDIVLIILDAGKTKESHIKDLYGFYENKINNKVVFIVINKIDTIKKEDVLVIIDFISKNIKFHEVIPVSALKNFNTEKLKELIIKYLPEHEFYFEPEELTDRSERFFISEIIREQILLLVKEEIPYSVFIEINEFKERNDGLIYINSNIILDKESQKKIILGKSGNMIKQIGENSRVKIEEFLNRKVYLDIFVKVEKNWRNNESFLKKNFNRNT